MSDGPRVLATWHVTYYLCGVDRRQVAQVDPQVLAELRQTERNMSWQEKQAPAADTPQSSYTFLEETSSVSQGSEKVKTFITRSTHSVSRPCFFRSVGVV